MKKIKVISIFTFFIASTLAVNSRILLDAQSLEKKVAELHLTLPTLSKPVANFVSYNHVGKLLYISGQLPFKENKEIAVKGQLGKEVSIEQGQEAAKICALFIIAHLHDALKKLGLKLKQCIKLNGYVSATADFIDHPKVINGASDLIVQILGESGKHARAAVGVSSLPLGAAVEIEAIFEVD